MNRKRRFYFHAAHTLNPRDSASLRAEYNRAAEAQVCKQPQGCGAMYTFAVLIGMTITLFHPLLDNDGGIAQRFVDSIVAGLR